MAVHGLIYGLIYGCICMCMSVFGWIWLYVWLHMAAYGCTWLHIASHDICVQTVLPVIWLLVNIDFCKWQGSRSSQPPSHIWLHVWFHIRLRVWLYMWLYKNWNYCVCLWPYMGRIWLYTTEECNVLYVNRALEQWLRMASYSCVWLHMAAYGCVRLHMAAHGCIWLHM